MYRESEILHVDVAVDFDRFEKFEQGYTLIPWRPCAALHDIIAFERRKGDALQIGDAERCDEPAIFGGYFIETLTGEIHQVHLVYGKHHVADPQQRHQVAVATGLSDDSAAGIDEDDCEIRCRAARDHVACILFVSRSIGDDEFSPVGREIAIGDIDGDALFAFGLQTVAQQRVIDVVAGVAAAFAVPLESVELIFVEFFTVEKQTPDER